MIGGVSLWPTIWNVRDYSCKCHNFFNLFSDSFDILKVNRTVNEEGVDFMNILFAEDDESLGKLIFHLLQKEFHRVDWVKDGQSAYDYSMLTDYDVIILDWMMPKLSGIETCKNLEKRIIKGGIIFLTAKDSLEDVVTG